MKKLILAFTALAFGANVNAQEGLEGRSFIMGQVGYSQTYDSYKSDVYKSTKEQSYSILPSYAYFISPSVAIGGALGYKGTTGYVGNDADIKRTTNEFIIQPMIRKYWGVANNLYIFGQASIPVTFGDAKVGDTKQEFTSYGFEVKPGIDYFLSKNWSVEATVGLFGWNAYNPKGGSNTNDFNFGINSGLIGGLNIGVKYVF